MKRISTFVLLVVLLAVLASLPACVGIGANGELISRDACYQKGCTWNGTTARCECLGFEKPREPW